MKKLIYSFAATSLVILATAPTKADGSTGIVSSTTTQISQTVQNGTSSTALTQGSSTTVGNQVGASTGTQAGASATPSQLPSYLSNPTVQPSGGVNVGGVITPQGTVVGATADPTVNAGNLATVTICANANANVGSTNGTTINSNCSNQAQAKKVPESGAVVGIILLGAYLILRTRKTSELSNV